MSGQVPRRWGMGVDAALRRPPQCRCFRACRCATHRAAVAIKLATSSHPSAIGMPSSASKGVMSKEKV